MIVRTSGSIGCAEAAIRGRQQWVCAVEGGVFQWV